MSQFDVAIAGSDQASALLAGLLAQEHDKKVLLIQHIAAPYRLQRDFHLSFPVATRPETFAFVCELENEANRLLAKIAGRNVLTSVSPICLAQTAEGAEALHHMGHMARYFGLEMVRTGDGDGATATRFRIRGGHWVRPRLLWPPLTDWVSRAEVRVINAAECKITTHRDGTVRVELDQDAHEAERLVFADGVTLHEFGHKGDLGQDFIDCWGTSLLTETADMHEEIVLQPERGFCAWRQSNGTLGMVAQVPADQIGHLAKANLSTDRKLRRAGQAEFVQAVSRDGAPVVGRFSRSGAWVAVGFGQAGLHVVPAIARFLAGKASESETKYLHARAPGAARGLVADFGLLADNLASAQ